MSPQQGRQNFRCHQDERPNKLDKGSSICTRHQSFFASGHLVWYSSTSKPCSKAGMTPDSNATKLLAELHNRRARKRRSCTCSSSLLRSRFNFATQHHVLVSPGWPSSTVSANTLQQDTMQKTETRSTDVFSTVSEWLWHSSRLILSSSVPAHSATSP